MNTAIVNGVRREVPIIKRTEDVQFAFWSWKQLPFFMVWRVWYDEEAEVEFAAIMFNSVDWIGF